MLNPIKNAAFALAASGLVLAAAPAAAVDFGSSQGAAPIEESFNQYRDRDGYDRYDRYDRRDRHDRRDRYDDRRYGDRYDRYDRREVNHRRNDDRRYCQKKDGTTGLIVGGAAGALLGREVDSRGDRTLGTVLGAAAGALLGKQVAQGTGCR